MRLRKNFPWGFLRNLIFKKYLRSLVFLRLAIADLSSQRRFFSMSRILDTFDVGGPNLMIWKLHINRQFCTHYSYVFPKVNFIPIYVVSRLEFEFAVLGIRKLGELQSETWIVKILRGWEVTLIENLLQKDDVSKLDGVSDQMLNLNFVLVVLIQLPLLKNLYFLLKSEFFVFVESVLD